LCAVVDTKADQVEGDSFEPAWLLHRKVGWFLALQDAAYIEPTL
jgi:hypothetical protein